MYSCNGVTCVPVCHFLFQHWIFCQQKTGSVEQPGALLSVDQHNGKPSQRKSLFASFELSLTCDLISEWQYRNLVLVQCITCLCWLVAALKHSPSKKKSMVGRTRTQTLNEEMAAQQGKMMEKTARTISFSDEQGNRVESNQLCFFPIPLLHCACTSQNTRVLWTASVLTPSSGKHNLVQQMFKESSALGRW